MTTPKRVHGINWRQHDDTDDDLDAMQVDADQAAERARIATWMRGKARVGLATEGTNKDVLYALLAYADAIDANRIDP
jgi:hypothetical protein